MCWEKYNDKKWRKKLPKEFQNCSEEELQKRIEDLHREFQELVKDGDCSEEELLQFLTKNEPFISALELQNRYQLEKRILER